MEEMGGSKEGNAQSIAAVVIAFDRLAVNEPGDRASIAPTKERRTRESTGARPVSQQRLIDCQVTPFCHYTLENFPIQLGRLTPHKTPLPLIQRERDSGTAASQPAASKTQFIFSFFFCCWLSVVSAVYVLCVSIRTVSTLTGGSLCHYRSC